MLVHCQVCNPIKLDTAILNNPSHEKKKKAVTFPLHREDLLFISERFSRDAQKLILEYKKLAKPRPWKVGTARIRISNVLPNQVNTPLIPIPGCG